MPDYGMTKIFNGAKKFLGKTFTPQNFMDGIDGHVVHYREEYYQHLFAYRLDDALCIDQDAWNFAVAQGAAFLTAWIRDKEAFAFVEAAVVNNSPIRNMGEGWQYRVPISRVSFWKKKNGACKPPNIPFIDDADCYDLDMWRDGIPQ